MTEEQLASQHGHCSILRVSVAFPYTSPLALVGPTSIKAEITAAGVCPRKQNWREGFGVCGAGEKLSIMSKEQVNIKDMAVLG
jgi:hypothetical protein